MVAFVDDNGPDTLYTFKQQNGINTAEALEDLQLAGIDGGRVVNGDLQIIQDDNGPSPRHSSDSSCATGNPNLPPVRAIFVEKTPNTWTMPPSRKSRPSGRNTPAHKGLKSAGPFRT